MPESALLLDSLRLQQTGGQRACSGKCSPGLELAGSPSCHHDTEPGWSEAQAGLIQVPKSGLASPSEIMWDRALSWCIQPWPPTRKGKLQRKLSK